ncbi:MAG: 3-phosphoshikimate 1-carboxyvinyltransferase [Thermodesulfovibrionales bacterium]|nr:3-phosphoshikimate 1-carboxyvinyltransferase [Thermodesulfovibrionales bacterium]
MSDSIELRKAQRLKGELIPPPDKSISHRAVILSSLAKGKSIVRNFLRAEDTMRTMNAMKMLGVDIEQQTSRAAEQQSKGKDTTALLHYCSTDLVIHSNGIHGLQEPEDVIDCGNSGTTIRLLSGVLSGNPFLSVLTGDSSLRSRPMGRVITPLRQMGADIMARDNDRYPPIAVRGRKLKAIKYDMPVASAQVKSALLLAGLYADGETEISEPIKSRDHTERMLSSYGVRIDIEGLKIKIKGGQELKAKDMDVPGDFSSAAFFIVAALLIPDSDITIKGVGINPTRTGLLDVLKSMGAEIELTNIRDVSLNSSLFADEPVADIHCKGGKGLKAVNITKEQIPALIDEFPILCIAATQADGVTTIRGAEELRVKESDRIKAMATEMRKMGVEAEELSDGISIKGNANLKGASINSCGDHRIAMAFSVAALIAKGTTTIKGTSAVNISFPKFFEILKGLTK